MKYFANFVANNGMSLVHDICDNNKSRLIRTISTIANRNRFHLGYCNWKVFDENGYCVAAGYTERDGRRRRLSHLNLQYYYKKI